MKNKDLDGTLTQQAGGQGSVKVPGSNIDAFVARMKVLVDHFGSMAKVAQKGGFAESTVKKWVDGISDPSRARCVQLARGTGVSLLWLAAGEGGMWPTEGAETAQPRQSHPVRLDQDMLADAIGAVGAALDALDADLSAQATARVVAVVYARLADAREQRSAADLVAFTLRSIREEITSESKEQGP